MTRVLRWTLHDFRYPINDSTDTTRQTGSKKQHKLFLGQEIRRIHIGNLGTGWKPNV